MSTTDLLEHSEIPKSLLDSCKKYPKHQWVYSTTRILDMQHIPWSMYASDTCKYAIDAINYDSVVSHDNLPCEIDSIVEGKIFTDLLRGPEMLTEVAVFKGDIKWITHYSNENGTYRAKPEINGDIELKINALIHMHFPKYVGVLTIQSISKDIIGVNLYINKELDSCLTIEQKKNIIKIYNNRTWNK